MLDLELIQVSKKDQEISPSTRQWGNELHETQLIPQGPILQTWINFGLGMDN